MLLATAEGFFATPSVDVWLIWHVYMPNPASVPVLLSKRALTLRSPSWYMEDCEQSWFLRPMTIRWTWRRVRNACPGTLGRLAASLRVPSRHKHPRSAGVFVFPRSCNQESAHSHDSLLLSPEVGGPKIRSLSLVLTAALVVLQEIGSRAPLQLNRAWSHKKRNGSVPPVRTFSPMNRRSFRWESQQMTLPIVRKLIIVTQPPRSTRLLTYLFNEPADEIFGNREPANTSYSFRFPFPVPPPNRQSTCPCGNDGPSDGWAGNEVV